MSKVFYSEELADKICELISSGKGVKNICEMEGMPCRYSINLWRREYEDFNRKYMVAMLVNAEITFEDMVGIAESAVETATGVQKARLIIDTKKWCLERMHAKYRPHLNVTSNITSQSDEELERIAAGHHQTASG